MFQAEHEAPPLGDESDDEVEVCHQDWYKCYIGSQTDLVNDKELTRKEQKALDTEIPWREIISKGGGYLKEFVKAAEKEHQSWMEWGPVVPLSRKESDEVFKDPLQRRRIMRTRSCYRDKNTGTAPLKAKARVVVLGHKDPDLHMINRDSPTPSRLSEMILLTIYISGANQRFGSSKKSWLLQAADASTAFLQGKQPEAERPGSLYMTPPTDGIISQMSSGWEAPLYRIVGNVYGLANAPRLWALEVADQLHKAGFCTHTLDKMLFVHRDSKSEVDCLALVYVDDFLVTFREDYNIQELYDMFKWGGWTKATDGIKFKGKEIKTTWEDNEWILTLSQKDFIRSMQPGKITRSRANQSPTLTTEEMTEFRSCCGSLQWLVGQTRPDGAACVSLSNKGTETTVEDLKRLYKLMGYFKATEDSCITLKPIDINQDTLVVSYGDCSWANAQNMKSQEGIVVVVTSKECLEGKSRCVLLDWKTTRTPRVVRSTIAGEAYAADDAIDRASLANSMLTELLTGESVTKTGPKLQHAHATDCRSLFDAVISSNPNTEEKRVLLTVRAIQEAIDTRLMRWVPTTMMVADVLTKDAEALRWAFLPWLREPVCQLRET